ncbi:hypothetical protein [Fundidesulfovibrio agrisoli]|uniref:hypothetical protein n=1 Tax=Fundidesulfovibrio agrisoli TaxID=2922717 RepID=UPI001FAC7CCD|nr:hypothetical protein [Fundidesulfovibrio agrisoli]
MRRALALLALLLAGLAAVAPCRAAAPAEGKPLALPPALFGARNPGEGAAVEGEMLGRVAMRKVKYSRVLAQRELPLPRRGNAPTGALEVLALAGADSGLRLGDSNEARLDYLTGDPDHPGRLAFWAELATPGGVRFYAGDPLETVDRLTPRWADGAGRDAVDVAGARWLSKGLRYQLSRLLDREPDEDWRTSQDGLSAFVQRRFRKDVTDVGALDVVLLRGQDVQVNLVVSLKPDGSGKTVLDWYAIPKRLFDLGDGRAVLRLYLGRHLRELAPGVGKVTLKELALMFYKQNVEEVAQARNVEKILFVPSGLDPAWTATHGLPRLLPSRARELFQGRGELAANLEALSGAGTDASIKGFGLIQSAQDSSQPFSLTLEAARLAKVAPRRDVPAILAATEERCRSFGAACDPDSPRGYASQSPLWSLDFQALAGGPGARDDTAVRPALAENLFKATGRLGFSGAPDGLGVECAGDSVTLETGTAFTPSPATAYSLWLELGRHRAGLAGVEAEAWGGGRSVRVAVKPGFPAVFPELPPKVEGVRLIFTGAGSPGGQDFGFTLRRAALHAQNTAAPHEGLFEARYLFDEALEPAVDAQPDGSVRLGLTGPAFAPQWLVLDVTAAPWTVNDPAPRLELAFGSKKASVPLASPSSRLALYLPALLGPQSPAALAAAWPAVSVTLSGGAPHGAGGGTWKCTRAVLSGQRLTTWPQVLGGEPLLDLAGAARGLEGLDASGAADMAAAAVWLPMGKAGLSPASGPLRFLRNPWLEVEALMLADASGPELSTLARAPESGGGAGSGRSAKWLYALALLPMAGLVWLAARKGLLAAGLASARRWLDGPAQGKASLRAWLLLAGLCLAAALAGGPKLAQGIGMLGSTLAVPLWRACRPALARRWPRLASTSGIHYCSGFLALSALAALIRLTGLAPVSELFGLCGLWLFIAALLGPSTSSPSRTGGAS